MSLLSHRGTESFDVCHLRSLLLTVLQHSVTGERVGAEQELTAASVLVPLIARESGISVLFTQRTAHLKDHPGQISFPGGRVEAQDATPAQTALREAQEEIGLSSTAIEVLGYLPEHPTSTGFLVTPVVGIVTPPFDLCAHSGEVARIFEVPLAFLMDSANHQAHSWSKGGAILHSIALSYGENFIWGATASIVIELFRALNAAAASE